MNFWDFRSICTLPVAALLLATPAGLHAAGKTDREVQSLANFPALQRLGHGKSSAAHNYLDRVAEAYRRAGYRSFASSLANADALIDLFGNAKEATPKSARRARTALRQLKSALAKNHFLSLPGKAGQKIPNYYGIAATFLKNSTRALRNFAAEKNIANTLRQAPKLSWLTNLDSSTFSVSWTDGAILKFTTTGVLTTTGTWGTDAGFYTGTGTLSGELSVTGTGTLTWPATDLSNYTGGSIPGSFIINPNSVLVPGVSNVGLDSLFGIIILNVQAGTTLTLASGRWVILPADYVFTVGQSSVVPVVVPQTFGNAVTINGTPYPAGTLIAKVADDFVVSESMVALESPVTIVGVATPTPTPTP